MKVNYVTDNIGSEGAPLCFPSLLTGFSFSYFGRVNNLVPTGDYTFVGNLSPSA